MRTDQSQFSTGAVTTFGCVGVSQKSSLNHGLNDLSSPRGNATPEGALNVSMNFSPQQGRSGDIETGDIGDGIKLN